MQPQRVQKIIANSGFCSRRKAKELIKAGKVIVNNRKIKIGEKIPPESKIIIGKQIIKKPKKVYIMLNKPRGYITTLSDPFNRKTVIQLIDIPERIYPIGRLDRDVEGLLLLTNDGEIANKIMHPSYEIPKTYYVKLDKPITKAIIAKIHQGVKIEKQKVRGKIKKISKDICELTIHLGTNKIVKRIFKKLDYHVVYMRRIKIGKLSIRNLKVGKWRYLNKSELTGLFQKSKN